MNDPPLVLGRREVPDAGDRIRRYCGLEWSGGAPQTWAFPYYDGVPATRDYEVSPVDVLAAGVLHPGLSRRDLAFFAERANDLSSWLRRLDVGMRLHEADEAETIHIASLVRFGGDVSLSLLSKVLHRKRPLSVPLLDRHIIDWYRPLTGMRAAAEAWEPVVRAVRDDLRVEVTRLSLAMLELSLSKDLEIPVPGWLRLIDIAVWMGGQRS